MIARLTRFVSRLVFKTQSSQTLLQALPKHPNGRVLLIVDILKERQVFQDGTAQGADWARLHGQQLALATAILNGVKFAEADLKEAYFGKSQLSGANFRQTDLTSANFRDAILTGADFTNAKAPHAYFAGANLQGAKFDGADLRGANFWGADVTGASFERALTDDETIMPNIP